MEEQLKPLEWARKVLKSSGSSYTPLSRSAAKWIVDNWQTRQPDLVPLDEEELKNIGYYDLDGHFHYIADSCVKAIIQTFGTQSQCAGLTTPSEPLWPEKRIQLSNDSDFIRGKIIGYNSAIDACILAFREWQKEQKNMTEPCPNCKETIEQCACMRNVCIKCKKPVGNITFTVCDDCWDKPQQPERMEQVVSVEEIEGLIVSTIELKIVEPNLLVQLAQVIAEHLNKRMRGE